MSILTWYVNLLLRRTFNLRYNLDFLVESKLWLKKMYVVFNFNFLRYIFEISM